MSVVESRQLVLREVDSVAGKCVIYVMSRDQRVHDNDALYAAQTNANKAGLPLLVVFCLYRKSGQRAREHVRFMIDGLKDVEASLAQFNIGFMMLVGDPKEVLMNTFTHLKPSVVYFDFSPLKGPRALQKYIVSKVSCRVVVVDTHNIVPVWVASTKQEVGARTLRPKLRKLLDQYVSDSEQSLSKQSRVWPERIMSIDELKETYQDILAAMPSNRQVLRWVPGEQAALRAMQGFIGSRLAAYALERNDPSKQGLSDLSPYLHFGQLSSKTVVRAVLAAVEANKELSLAAETLVDEMIVRKELSDNFCLYGEDYCSLQGAPQWAQKTLEKHQADTREYTYTRLEFEQAKTHDSAWNAAQTELIKTGKMHGYMRMYWAKKVLEWSVSPQEALETLIYLNDLYSIDGGDPNGYVGILWSIAGLHDRPWGERAIYGTVRCMVYTGLKRKFNIAQYENNWLNEPRTSAESY